MPTDPAPDFSQLAQATRRPPPEIVTVMDHAVYCDGSGYGDGGVHKDCANIPAALGHPRVYLTIPGDQKFTDCTYCDRRFLLEG